MEDYIKYKLIEENRIKYYKDQDRLRKVIKDDNTKNELLLQAHAVGMRVFQTYN